MFIANVWEKIKEILKGMISPKDIEHILHIKPKTNQYMINANEL